ncbi:MAG: hypothetical protein ACYCSX_03935 [Acidimicrobiales bacterium]
MPGSVDPFGTLAAVLAGPPGTAVRRPTCGSTVRAASDATPAVAARETAGRSKGRRGDGRAR